MMKIDPRDLIPMQLGEFKPDGYFYLQDSPGEYSLMTFSQESISTPCYADVIRSFLKEKSKAGLLFLNRTRPWRTFSK